MCHGTLLLCCWLLNSLMTQWFFNRGVVEQTKAFMAGFNEVVPLQWLHYFDEREFEVCFMWTFRVQLIYPTKVEVMRSLEFVIL